MMTTPNPNANDLTKGTDVPESARLLLNVPHVPSFHTMRSIVCGTSHVLVEHTNLTCVVKDRCTTHLNLSVDHLVVEQRTLELFMLFDTTRDL